MQSEIWAGCQHMSPKWEAIGLVNDFIKGRTSINTSPMQALTHLDVGPLCNTSISASPSVDIMPYVDQFTTSIFISQLLSTFNNTDAYVHLCNDIGFNMVSSFGINDRLVEQAVCSAAGVQTKPRPEATLPWASNNAVRAARNTASVLFSVIWATAATSDSQLNIACARAPDYTLHLNNEQLNGTLVQSTLCSFKSPVSVKSAHHLVRTWMSRYFTTVLENIGQGDAWLGWLCSNVDPEKLNAAGLYGYGIHTQVCDDSKSSGSERS